MSSARAAVEPPPTAQPPITATSTPDDVVAWMATLDGGKDELRSYFSQIRRLELGGAALLRVKPEFTVAKLGVNPNSTHSEYLSGELRQLREHYLRWSVDRELGRTNEAEGKSPVRSKSIWGRVRGPTRKDTGASVNRPSPAPARPSPRPPRPPHASAGNRTDTGSSVGRGRATSDGTASHTPTLGPVETRGWLVLKEGYLNKTKWTSSRVVSVKSTKLRYFFLKQNPDTLVARLEYYEGLILKGSLELVDAEILLEGPGRFVIIINEREVHLSTEKYDVELAMGWVLALQHASLGPDGAQKGCRKSVAGPRDAYIRKPRPPRAALPGISEDTNQAKAPTAGPPWETERPLTISPEADAYWKEREANADQEIDGTKIDDARWAALRKGWLRDQGLDSEAIEETPELDEEDEDVRLMREMEEEEERRQEEERLAFLAEREKKKLESAAAAAAPEAADADAIAEAVEPPAEEPDGGEGEGEGDQNFSEDEADWFAEMQAQEEAEAARQEQERLEWLRERAQNNRDQST